MYYASRIQPQYHYSVYVLIEPGTENTDDPYIRYVGITGHSLHQRLSEHIADAKAGRMGNLALSHWILNCLKRKKRPVILLKQPCVSLLQAELSETHHIAQCATLYPNLFNERDNLLRSTPRPFTETYIKAVS